MTSTTRAIAEQQYWAAKRYAALADLSAWGRLRMTGGDSLDLLHRLSTQDLWHIAPGQGVQTVLASEKGRVVDLLTVYRFPEHLLLTTAPGNQGAVLAWLDKYTISEDSQALDVTSSTAMLALLGPAAAAMLTGVGGGALDGLPLHHHAQAVLGGREVTLARALLPAGGGFIVMCDSDALPAVRGVLLAAGAMELGTAVYEALRIEAGIPVFGAELGEEHNPLEAGLEECISFSKGCYIGQEVIARLDTYQKVQRRLVALRLSAGPAPASGTPLLHEGAEVGRVTSSAQEPGQDAPVALAYVRTKWAAPGTRVTVGETEAEVAARGGR